MTQLHPYLFFDGNCLEAMNFYQQSIGGELHIMSNADAPATGAPSTASDGVMHATLQKDKFMLMAADGMPGSAVQQGNHLFLSISVESVPEAERVFAALSEKGKVIMALDKTLWATRFGMLQDRYGFSWMVNCEEK